MSEHWIVTGRIWGGDSHTLVFVRGHDEAGAPIMSPLGAAERLNALERELELLRTVYHAADALDTAIVTTPYLGSFDAAAVEALEAALAAAKEVVG